MRPDPYAELPAVPAFQVGSRVVADGVTMPVAQRSGIFGAGGRGRGSWGRRGVSSSRCTTRMRRRRAVSGTGL